MILGIGSDIVDIRRIERLLERYGPRFAARVFSPEEQALCEGRGAGRAAAYAKRFAAKEACAKALGTGIRGAVGLTTIAVENDGNGAPALRLSGGAQARLAALTPSGMQAAVHLSLSDEPPLAQAFVVLSAVAGC